MADGRQRASRLAAGLLQVVAALSLLPHCGGDSKAKASPSSLGGATSASASGSTGTTGGAQGGVNVGDQVTLPNGDVGTINEDGNAVLPDGTVVDPNTGAVVETPDEPEPTLPPEQEVESSFRAPVATGRYLWSANPSSGRVALIDTDVLDVLIVDAGFGPTYLAGVPSDDEDVSSAIVLNTVSRDATWIRVNAEREVESETFPTHSGANRWAISPSGDWATAWTSAEDVANPDPTDGYQDITIISLAEHGVTRLSVGYRPSQVVYDDAEDRLFVVTEPGISVIDLSGDEPETVALVDLGGEAGVNTRDVSITPDGTLALVRREGERYVGVAAIEDDTFTTLSLPGVVTDLDLSADGTRAVAVVRETSEIFVLDVGALGGDAEPQFDTLSVEDTTIGSVALSPQADVAVLYTNAAEEDEVTIVSLESDDYLAYRTVTVQAPVRAVFLAPDGEHAVALLDVPDGSNKAGAFSLLVTKEQRAPKIVGTDAPPVAVAISPESPSLSALVTTRDDENGIYEAHLVRLPTLQVDQYPLASPPLATGIVSDVGFGYVAQQHPEGRITFIDLQDGDAQTLTGFELAVKVVD